jgi:N-acetylglucosaminyl-diphospho-decaprenol L-rhamnosyltransferase
MMGESGALCAAMSGARVKAVVTVVTYDNDSSQLDLYARAYAPSAEFAGAVAEVSLLYTDNGTPSELASRVSGARVLESSGNIGFGPALHRLLRHAFDELRADVVVTSNPDGAFHHDCLALLLAPLRADPGQLLEARQFPVEHPKTYDAKTGDTAWASGCCVAISRAVYERVGNVDPVFWLYLEDVDYSWRVRASGMPVRIVHEALYAHEVSDGRESPFVRRQMFLSGRALARKWRNPKFERRCERLLAEELGVGPHDWPSLDAVAPVPPAWTAVADFSHSFLFATRRW